MVDKDKVIRILQKQFDVDQSVFVIDPDGNVIGNTIEHKVLDLQATTNAYVDSAIVTLKPKGKVLFYIRNAGLFSLDFKILACASELDNDADFVELKGETALAGSASTYETLEDAWMRVKFQIKAYSPGNQTAADAWINVRS